MNTLDIDQLIRDAKLGRERKAAQKDTCSIFALALNDALSEAGIECRLKCVSFYFYPFTKPEWYHSVVEVDGTLFDSKGIFSHEIIRTRLKIHPSVQSRIWIEPDDRESLIDPEFDALYEFLKKKMGQKIPNRVPDNQSRHAAAQR